MAKKTATKNNKNLIIGICAAVAAIIVIVIIVVIILLNPSNGPLGGINDSYFVSDGTKYVLNLDAESVYVENEDYVPLESHLVYHYSGDSITGLEAYYEYADNTAASAAYEFYKTNNDNMYKDVTLDGKFVILTANPEEYEGLTADDVKQQIEFMDMLNNMNSDNDDSNTDTEEE